MLRPAPLVNYQHRQALYTVFGLNMKLTDVSLHFFGLRPEHARESYLLSSEHEKKLWVNSDFWELGLLTQYFQVFDHKTANHKAAFPFLPQFRDYKNTKGNPIGRKLS